MSATPANPSHSSNASPSGADDTPSPIIVPDSPVLVPWKRGFFDPTPEWDDVRTRDRLWS
jgi:hypothetical protein